ncbi:uncharacterized protein ACRADG_000534 [Cochliomyia hominivorax]
MNASNDNFTTPKQTKRLGLRRTSSILRNNSANKAIESAAKSKVLTFETPESSPKRKLTQSDVKVNYRNLQQNGETKNNTPATPKNAASAEVSRFAVSTNCRPYRLALSKRVREKMTKKRLEFYLANELEKEDEESDDKRGKEPETKEDLLKAIEMARKELKSRQEHMKKVQELQQAINVWKEGFSSALQDLQQKIEPRLETNVLLERLHISPEMLKYIKD